MCYDISTKTVPLLTYGQFQAILGQLMSDIVHEIVHRIANKIVHNNARNVEVKMSNAFPVEKSQTKMGRKS
jgi:hypothetical protein